MEEPQQSQTSTGDTFDIKAEEAFGVIAMFVLSFFLLFALLRCQRRNRKLLEEKAKKLEKALQEAREE
jgi:hypothetical protein